jgi:uncharacterized membrane protein
MTRNEFFAALGAELAGIPAEEAKKVLDYYAEYFDEAAEAGKTDEQIIASVDVPSAIATRVRSEAVFAQAEKKPSMANWLKALIVVLGVAASPIALPVAIAIFVVIIAIFIAVFSVIFALAAAALGVFAAGVSVIGFAIASFATAAPVTGIALLGAGLVVCGVAIFLAVGMVAAIRALVLVTTRLARGIYNKASKKNRGNAMGGKQS